MISSPVDDHHYRQLFAQLEQAFCIIAPLFDTNGHTIDYRYLETNPAFELLTSMHSVVGKTVREVLPNVEAHWIERFGQVLQDGVSAHYTEHSPALGRWFNVAAYRVGTGEVAVLFTDVTEHRRAELGLREKDRALRSLIEQAPVAMFVFRGADMIVETANRRALEMIRRTETAIGRPLLEVVPELRGTPNYAIFEQVYASGEAQEGREVLVPLERRGRLEDRYFNFTYTPLVENGQVVGVIDVAVEVTDQVLARKKIEELVASRTSELADANAALQGSNRELLRSNQYLEEFAHAASHDLKEPVRKVRFYTEHLRQQLGSYLSAAQTRSFERIENAAQRMGLLIDDLLQYSHVSQAPLQQEAVDLNERLARVLDDLELDIREKGAQIDADPLPTVPGYGRQLQQLLQNLVSNALKYSRAGVPPRIRISTEAVERDGRRYVVLVIRDNGIGFDPEHREKIFQMFTRLHHKHEYSGTGVGLSIVKKVVEHHQGFIEAEGHPGAGATFRVGLPV